MGSSELVGAQLRVLGPLQVANGHRLAELGPGQERALLALLAVEANHTVSADLLIDELWGATPPRSASISLRVLISKVRRALKELGADATIETRSSGYVLKIAREQTDLGRFESLAAQGRAELEGGDPSSAAATLRDALALWRGPAFVDVAEAGSARAQATRLEEDRLAVLEDRIDADLQCSRHAGLVGELDALVQAYPFRERLWRARMLALYRCGRQVDALNAFRGLREMLADDVGIDPGAETVELHQAILTQSSALDLPAPAGHRELHDIDAEGRSVLPTRPAPPTRLIGRQPEIHYAKDGDVYVAYHVFGVDSPDLLAFSSAMLPIDAMNDEPSLARFHNRLASFTRLIRFDERGVGLSDPVTPSSPPTLEQWMQDALAVMEAAGSEPTAVFAPSDASLQAVLLAATYPDRVSSLVFVNGSARIAKAEDYPVGIPWPVLDRFLEVNMEPDAVDRGFDALALFAPSVAGDEDFRAWWNRAGNRGASPAAARLIQRVKFQADVRALLPLVTVPTLILHRRDDAILRVGHGRYLAEHVPDAKYVELPGADDLYWVGDTDEMLDEIEEFITGVRHGPEPDRVLATVLLTDIVGSTERMAEMGERRWRDLLDRHDLAVRRQLERFRGREIKMTGDGVLATFDGPARAVICARAIRDAASKLGVEIRVGVHTGEVEVRGEDIGGMAVHIAARVGALAQPSQVLVSRTVVDLMVGSGIETTDRGEHVLKGVPGSWRLFAVEG